MKRESKSSVHACMHAAATHPAMCLLAELGWGVDPTSSSRQPSLLPCADWCDGSTMQAGRFAMHAPAGKSTNPLSHPSSRTPHPPTHTDRRTALSWCACLDPDVSNLTAVSHMHALSPHPPPRTPHPTPQQPPACPPTHTCSELPPVWSYEVLMAPGLSEHQVIVHHDKVG